MRENIITYLKNNSAMWMPELQNVPAGFLPLSHLTLSLEKEQLGVVAHTCNPNPWETETEELSRLCSEFQDSLGHRVRSSTPFMTTVK